MKTVKLAFGILLTGFCVNTGFGWGFLPEMMQDSSLLFTYLGKKQVVQPVCIRTVQEGDTFAPGLGKYKNQEGLLLQKTQVAFDYWINGLPAFLEASGRADEFRDLLTIWPQQVVLQRNENCSNPDTLILEFTTNKSRFEAKAYASQRGGRIRIFGEDALLFSALKDDSLLGHEVGHLMGLADQYRGANDMGSEYHMHPDFSFLSVLNTDGGSLRDVQRRFWVKSMMTDKKNDMRQMYPDDADGVINLVDFIQVYRRNQPSRRATQGWKSFSLGNQNVYYAYALPFRVNPAEAEVRPPESLLAKVQKYKNPGNINEAEIAQFEALYREAENYVVQATKKIQELEKTPGVEVASHDSLKELSRQELQRLMARAKVEYYTKRILPLQSILEGTFSTLEIQMREYRTDDINRDIRRGEAFMNRMINGKRVYAYDKSEMKKVLAFMGKFKQKYPDYPNVNAISKEELNQTSAKYILEQTTVKHCAVCGKTLPEGTGVMKGVRAGNSVSYYFVCEEHSGKIPGLKQYMFKDQNQAVNKIVSVTYKMAAQELASRKTEQMVKESLQAHFNNAAATRRMTH